MERVRDRIWTLHGGKQLRTWQITQKVELIVPPESIMDGDSELASEKKEGSAATAVTAADSLGERKETESGLSASDGELKKADESPVRERVAAASSSSGSIPPSSAAEEAMRNPEELQSQLKAIDQEVAELQERLEKKKKMKETLEQYFRLVAEEAASSH